MNALATKTGPHVLIVDDDPSMRALCKKFLEVAGFSISLAEDGESALRMLANATPDVVLLDFMMPGMSGPDLVRLMRARETLNDVPVVMLTADDQPESIEDGFAAGATDYLTKPVDRRILAARLSAAVESRKDKKRLDEVEETERDRDRMRAELEKGRSLQRAQIAQMPQLHGDWALTGALQPCGEVGGDMFDVIPGTKTTLAMIDVSGHGLSSAMVASSVRSMLRLVLRNSNLSEALTQIGDHLAESQGGHYACIALVELDGTRVSIVNAGLPPIAVVDRNTGTVVRTVSGAGIPPGLVQGETYEVTSFEVTAGARLVLLSDGLTEPFGATDGIEPCLERLGLMRDIPGQPGELEACIRQLFTSEQPDDATLVVADFDGACS